MRERLMATRMRYLQTALRSLRAEVSTDELIANPKLLLLIRSLEYHLKAMEAVYVGCPMSKRIG